jgi:hypothetical protein
VNRIAYFQALLAPIRRQHQIVHGAKEFPLRATGGPYHSPFAALESQELELGVAVATSDLFDQIWQMVLRAARGWAARYTRAKSPLQSIGMTQRRVY